MTTTEHDYAAQARQAIEIVCSGDVSRMEEFYSPDFVDHVNDMTFHGYDGGRESLAFYGTLFKDYSMGVEEQVTEGNRVASRWVLNGTYHGRAVTLRGITISRLDGDGRTVEDRGHSDRIAHGIYAWWLINPEALPSVPAMPHPSESAGLIYVGIAPGSAPSKRSLYKRFDDHTREAGRSTLRYGLASFLFEQEGWRLRWRTDRPLLAKPYDDALTAWMETTLRVQWVRRPQPLSIEPAIVREMLPPLNREHNQAHPFYEAVGKSRERFRKAAQAEGRQA